MRYRGTVGGIEIDADGALWGMLGSTVYTDGTAGHASPGADTYIVRALSEGLRGEDALRRAVAIRAEEQAAASVAAEPRRRVEADIALERMRLARIEAARAALAEGVPAEEL